MPGEIAPGPIALFYSYSHKDESLRDELAKHLTTLQRAGFIREWYDREIRAGDEWDRQINIRLETAEVILLLISPDFLASRYCYDIEAKRALERHIAGTARVIPIALRPVIWKLTPFAALQALPANAQAVTEWPNLDLAFVSICEGILAIVVAWKDSAAHLGRVAEEEPERPPLSPEWVRARKRALDAALPKHVQTGKATALVVMLRRESSSGLRAVVELDKSYGVEREDVRSTGSFRLDFPVSADGKVGPLDLELEVRAPDFEPQVQTKSIHVPPRGDSEPKVFLLTPERQGDLVLTVELLEDAKVIASCLLRTNAWASAQEIGPASHTLVSVPLNSPRLSSILTMPKRYTSVQPSAPAASAKPNERTGEHATEWGAPSGEPTPPRPIQRGDETADALLEDISSGASPTKLKTPPESDEQERPRTQAMRWEDERHVAECERIGPARSAEPEGSPAAPVPWKVPLLVLAGLVGLLALVYIGYVALR